MSARIVIDTDRFKRGKRGPSTGEVCVAFGDHLFPAPHWNDFVVVIAEAWAAALLRILSGASTFERIHFMEGPYEVVIRPLRNGVLQLCAMERGGTEHARAEVPTSTHLAEVMLAAESVVLACEKVGDTSIDAQRLRQSIPKLRTASTTQTPHAP